MYFSERSYEKIARPDLRKLLKHAYQDLESFLIEIPGGENYTQIELCVSHYAKGLHCTL